jgi:hypothetical protein
LYELLFAALKEGIECHLNKTALRLGSKDRMAFPRPCDTQSCKKPISSMMSGLTQHSFNHRHNARSLEDVHLARIFFENLRKRKSLDCTLAVVIDKWADGDMCWMAVISFFDCKESGVCRVGWAQSQVDIE